MYSSKEKRNEYARKWYAEHKEEHIKRNAKSKPDRYKKLKQLYVELKSTLKCNRCPEDEVCTLDFHHIDPNEKDFNLATAVCQGYSFERLKEEIAKCEVLCSNCHRKLHHNLKLQAENIAG